MSLETRLAPVSSNVNDVPKNVVDLRAAAGKSVSSMQATAHRLAKIRDEVDDMWDNVPV